MLCNAACHHTTGSPVTATEEGYSHSPYPEIDQFITKQLTRGGAQGAIRKWTLFPQGKLLIYDIRDYRWCENIRKQHKSNNIMLVCIDLCLIVAFVVTLLHTFMSHCHCQKHTVQKSISLIMIIQLVVPF